VLKIYYIYYLILGFENPAFAKIDEACEKIKKIKKNSKLDFYCTKQTHVLYRFQKLNVNLKISTAI
jgi:hypothetical protein